MITRAIASNTPPRSGGFAASKIQRNPARSGL